MFNTNSNRKVRCKNDIDQLAVMPKQEAYISYGSRISKSNMRNIYI